MYVCMMRVVSTHSFMVTVRLTFTGQGLPHEIRKYIHNTYSGTSPIWIPMGQKKMCCLLRCPHLEVEMHARVVHGGGKGVLFREVS